MTCLVASEVNAPAGTKPLVWRLLTNRTVSTLAAAVELIDWYRARWEIELFSWCSRRAVGSRRLQLSDVDRLQTALALYMVIAWRINRLMRLGRTLPIYGLTYCSTTDEWRAAFILNKKPVPKQTPTLNTVVRLIAQRGSFLGRKHDGEPGAKMILLGMGFREQWNVKHG